MISVHIEAQMPVEELETFLRLIRTWDGGRDTVRVAMKVDAHAYPVEDLRTIFERLDPPIPHIGLFRREP